MIYIQSTKNRTLPHHFDAACAMYGCMDEGLDYRLTTFEEIQSGKFDVLLKKNAAIGSSEFMQEVFKRIGKKPTLPMYSDRICKIMKLADVMVLIEAGEELFVKPVQNKLFSGTILNKLYISCVKDIPLDTDVMVFEVIKEKIVSEWRAYIHNGKVVDCRNYSGNFMITPRYQLILDKAKEQAETFPCAYTIDVGILDSGNNFIVEYNDFWAIGNYGIENGLYVRMLRDRYFEILKS